MKTTRYLLLMFSVLACSFKTYSQPQYKGGEQALQRFLESHIVYPEYSSKFCIAATIRVSFRVNKNGSVGQVKAYRGLGIDLDDEAIRVVKMTSGKWSLPAGTETANYLLPIRFTPDYSHCSNATNVSREEAIQAYRSRQELENAVTNYYENKYAGKADTTKESYILALKQQLGFDDELIEDVLNQASKKLKQGDKEGACADWKFIRNIGSNRADKFLAQYCK